MSNGESNGPRLTRPVKGHTLAQAKTNQTQNEFFKQGGDRQLSLAWAVLVMVDPMIDRLVNQFPLYQVRSSFFALEGKHTQRQ